MRTFPLDNQPSYVRTNKGIMQQEKLEELEFERLSAEILRTLRGKRSQEAFARRIGCRSHTIYTWESARSFPTAARLFRVAGLAGIDVQSALQRFYRKPPEFIQTLDITTPRGVAGLLNELRGTTTITSVATLVSRSRYAVRRWMRGEAQPRVPDFLRLVEAMSLRSLDFVACFVDPEQLSCVRSRYKGLEAMRRAAYDLPWSHAFLRALELADYQRLPCHQPGWLADWLGLSAEIEAECLALLEASGQIVFRNGRYRPTGAGLVDMRQNPAEARSLRLFFNQVATSRLQAAPDSLASTAYNLFGISHSDLERLRDLQRAYFRQMRAIIAQSAPVEAVVLANMHLLELRGTGTPEA